MNFLHEISKNQQGYDKALRTGKVNFDNITEGISESFTIIAAEPKLGKTQVMDNLWILSFYEMNPECNIVWLYYSFEISKENKIAKFLSYFIKKEFGVRLKPKYIKGKQLDMETGEIIIISEEHMEMIQAMYYKHIVPLFGGIDKNGNKVKGKILFFESYENPTGIKNTIITELKKYGKEIKNKVTVNDEYTGKPKEVEVFSHYEKTEDTKVILLIDTIRDAKNEQKNTLKANIDLLSSYCKELYKSYKVTICATVHLNRCFNDIDNIKFRKDFIHPNNDHLKDSGNPGEGCTMLITLFNPADKRYKLSQHFGILMNKVDKRTYRTLHIIFNRDGEGDKHLGYNMDLMCNSFEETGILADS